MEFRRATPGDYPAVFGLQTANLVDNLAPGDRGDGYLAAGFTLPQIERIAGDLGIVVAEDQGAVVGCVCILRPDFEESPPAMAEMVRRFDRVRYGGRLLSDRQPFVYGPVVVDRGYRRRGVLRGLYQRLLLEVAGRFDVGVAMVAADNRHSADAHILGLGMTAVGTFECRGRSYSILAFPVPPGGASRLPD